MVELPPEYPHRLIEHWVLRNGIAVTARAVRPDDLAMETEFVAGLSTQTSYRRLLSPRRPQAEELRRFTHIDYVNELALVAITTQDGAEQMVGVTRYVKETDAPERAGFAIVIADAWQGVGLGERLLRSLVQAAREAGIRELSDLTLATNRGMLSLAKRLGFRLEREWGDATVTRIRCLL